MQGSIYYYDVMHSPTYIINDITALYFWKMRNHDERVILQNIIATQLKEDPIKKRARGKKLFISFP